MRDLPSGTVTFLFTDVEGSTRRWEQDSPAMLAAVEHHFALLDTAIFANHGFRYKTIGDAVQAAFPTAIDGLNAAVAAQRALLGEDWGALGPLTVRMALHTGAATPQDGDYLAPVLNRLARLLAATSGGQMVITEATRNLVRDMLPNGVSLRDLGEHRLRDLREPEHVFQIDGEGLPTDFPPLRSLDRKMHNLPAQLTAFIGREREVAAAKERLAEPAVRLLTLTGPGGTGKTRLALRIASDLLSEYRDGVWFVPLAPVASAGRVASTIAEALGLRESPGEPIEETLRAYLSSRHLLLVLDNFEHVVDAAPLVAELLANHPEIQILATSRTPLRISGEHEHPVQPLGLPSDRAGARLDDVLASEAVQLFVDRARTVRGDFALTDENASLVVAICRRLDGLPLAIELAASRIKLLSLEAILSRLDSRLTLLTGGGRDRPERQQTLRGTIAWSHDLLDASEQLLFRRLAVFVGGWTLEAAEAVVNAAKPADILVIDCLSNLNDNSLIAGVEGGGADYDPRFAMLQTIREFALEQLAASGELDAMHQAHAVYFMALAREAEPHLTGPEAPSWLNQLETEHDNLRAALGWLREQHDAASAVQLAGDLWRFCWLRGHVREGREEIEAALALPGSDENDVTAIRAAALDGAGVLAETQGDYDRAEALHTQALAMAKALDDQAGIARALGNLGVIAFDRQDVQRAATLLEESLALARVLDDDHLVATALNDLGYVAHDRGDLTRAEALYRESLELRRRTGSSIDIARALNNLGGVAHMQGDVPRARRLYEESLARYRETGDAWGSAGALQGLALAMQDAGETEEASALMEESLTLLEETGDTRNAALTRLNLADAARESGNLESAAERFHAALRGYQRVNYPAGVAEALFGLASILAAEGRFERAARLLGAAAGHSPNADLNSPLATDRYGEDVAAVRAALGDDTFAANWEAGRALSPNEAVAEMATATIGDR